MGLIEKIIKFCESMDGCGCCPFDDEDEKLPDNCSFNIPVQWDSERIKAGLDEMDKLLTTGG